MQNVSSPTLKITTVARLIRTCDQLGLNLSKHQLIQTLVSHHSSYPTHSKPDEGDSQDESMNSQHPSFFTPHKRPSPHYSAQLKDMINKGGSWSELRSILKNWWLQEPRVTLANKILEMSYVWSGPESFLETLPWFSDLSGWPHLHEAIRKDMIIKGHQDSRIRPLMTYLKAQALSSWLISCERLAVFIEAYRGKNHTLVFKIHQRHAKELKAACDQYGPQLGLSYGELKYAASLARFEQGYVYDAHQLAQTILPSEAAYELASKLKRRIAATQKNSENSNLTSQISDQLLSQENWDQKEKVLRHYFESLRSNPNSSPAISSTLNEHLGQSSGIPIHHPVALSKYVGMCLEYFDLYDVLPNIIWVLKKNVCVFHSPSIDAAIWNHFLSGDIPDFPCEQWKGVALFHRFITWGPDAGEALWQSYEILRHDSSMNMIDEDFDSLKKSGLAHLESSPIHQPPQLKIMTAMCGICCEDHELNTSQIQTYLEDVPTPPYQTLHRLWQIAISKSSPELIRHVIHVMIQNTYMRSVHLKTYLSFSMQSQQADLGWRIATVLKSRTQPLPLIEQMWEVSGENRKQYHMVPLGVRDLAEVLTSRMNSSAWKVFCGLITMGYRIPELIACVSYRHESTKWRTPDEHSVEANILTQLKQYPWLHKPTKRVSDHAPHGFAAMGIVESSQWILTPYSCCVSFLLEFLGLISIGGDLLKINPLVSLTTKSDSIQYKQNPTKKMAVKWYRSLSGDQKIAWLDICRVTQQKVSVELSQDVLKLILRLAVMIMPAHYQALCSIQRLGMPLMYLRDLEAFILSDSYSTFRVIHKINHQVPIPSYPSIHSHLNTPDPLPHPQATLAAS